jgi:two-component system NtrC family sensor kinase
MASDISRNLIDGKYAISDLVDIERLRRIFELFHKCSGFTIGLVAHPGMDIVIAVGWRDICTHFHRGHPLSLLKCQRSNARLFGQLAEPGRVMIEECENGLMDCAFPIVVEGKHIATLATGQFFLKAPDIGRFKAQAAEFGLDEEKYLQALAAVPVVEESKLKDITGLFGEIALLVTELGYSNLRSRAEAERLAGEVRSRAEMEHRLLESQEHVRRIFDSLNDAILVHDMADGRILDVNQKFCDMFGFSHAEALELEVGDFSSGEPPYTQDDALLLIRMVREKGPQVAEWLCKRKDGHLFRVEVNLRSAVISGEERLLAVVRDIDDRKKTTSSLEKMVVARTSELELANEQLKQEVSAAHQAQAALQYSKDYFHKIINSVADPIFVKNRQHQWVLLNDAYCSFMGYAREELIGKSDHDFFPKDEARVFWEKDEDVFTSGRENINEEFFTDAHGERKTIITKKTLYVDEHGEEIIVGIIRDVTDLKRTAGELRAAYEKLVSAQERLVQSEKMASLGQLSAGVAHEINNPTAYVISNLEVLGGYIDKIFRLLEVYKQVEASLAADPSGPVKDALELISEFKEGVDFEYIFSDIRRLLQETNQGADRIKKIVGDLRVFTHRDKAVPEKADMNGVLDTALSIVLNEMKGKVDVLREYADVPQVLCYPQQLMQVFINLFMNAAQSITHKGSITVKTSCDAHSVLVEVRDTGCGIRQRDLQHIFEPFFTTKGVGVGTGLGLAIAYGIVQNHKGEITVKSEIGEGTTFLVKLPMNAFSSGKRVNGRKPRGK